MSNHGKKSIFFVEVPALEDLCSVTVKVPPLQNCAGSPYQPHIIRCRELIFTEPDIIASPLLHLDRHIQIIMQQKYYKTGKLQARFQKIGIEMQKPRRVLAPELQSCLNYTIQAKLAPLWNKYGELLVEGREFVASSARMKAVNFELTVSEGQAYLALSAHYIRCPPVQLRDLDVSRPLIQEFMNQYPDGHLEEYYIHRQWCHILPSMKKGQVVSVHHTVPQSSPFKSYKDMKRYWKNTYGYRLPESEEGVLFYEVYFKLVGERLFTYPHHCIRPSGPTYLPSGDTVAMMTSFLEDLQCKVTSLCGVRLRVTSQAQAPQAQLTDVSELNVHDVAPNLSTQAAGMGRCREMPLTSSLIQTGATLVQGQVITVPPSMRVQHNNHQQQISKGATVVESQTALSQNRPAQKILQSQAKNTSQMVQNSSKTTTVAGTARKIVPMFKPVMTKSHVPNFKPTEKRAKTVPVFKPNIPRPAAIVAVKSTGIAAMKRYIPISDENITKTQISTAKDPAKSQRNTWSQRPVDEEIHSPLKTVQRAPVSQRLPFTPRPNTSGRDWPSDSGYCSSVLTPGKGTPTQGLTPDKTTHSQIDFASLIPQIPGTPVLGGCGGDFVADTPSKWGISVLPESAKKPKVPCTPSKRLSEFQNDGTPKVKKPRAKPKVQDNVDVEMLARADQLGKVNTVTLMEWLRARGVVYKTKDKKADLVVKVQSVLAGGSSQC